MIYIVTHKKFEPLGEKKFYQPLLVGADNNGCSDYKLRDNQGENISNKNSSFCELTGLYWVWKNKRDDLVGLCHYRRYFAKRQLTGKNCILGQKEIENILKSNDIILPKKRWFSGKTAKKFYSKFHNIDDWNNMKKIMINLYPDYQEDIDWFEEEKSGYCYNMFITSRSLLNEYCEWLFRILFELEKLVDLQEYGAYNRRIYGFLAERMINIWVHHNNLKVYEMPVYNPELISMLANKSKNYINRKIRRIKW